MVLTKPFLSGLANRHDTMVSVKTETPVAKDRRMEVMALFRKSSVEAPLEIGDVALQDACGSRIVVTKTVDSYLRKGSL